MSNDLNQVQAIGRLGKDPESKATPGGTAVSTFSIACGWKSKDKEGTEWLPCVAFDKLAGICNQYLKKGSQVYISGRFRTRNWEKDGQTHYRTEIIVDKVQMLGPKPGADEQRGSVDDYRNRDTRQQRAATPAASVSGDAFVDDDIPF